MERVLKCDGVIVEKRSKDNKPEDVTPADILEIKSFVDANRPMSTPFDIVLNGSTAGLKQNQLQDKFHQLNDAGVTWWIEGLWESTEEKATERIQQGPPSLEK